MDYVNQEFAGQSIPGVSNNCSSCFTCNNINLGSWIFSASVSESVHWGHFSIVQVRVLGFLMTTKET